MKKGALIKKCMIFMKNRKVCLGITVTLFVLFTIVSLRTFSQSSKSLKQNKLNEITQKTNITYTTPGLPYGMVGEAGTIFSKSQNIINVRVVSSVESEKSISITGKSVIYYDLIADGLWQQHNALTKEIKLDYKGNKNTIIDENFQINMGDIKNTIDEIENQITGSSPDKYIFKIRPDIQANVNYDKKTIPLDNTNELSFEYSGGILRLVGENKEFIKNIAIVETIPADIKFSFLGMEIPVILSRYIFSIISILFLLLTLVNLKSLKPNLNIDKQSAAYIDKKYSNRLIYLKQEPKFPDKNFLEVGRFKELLSISDDKEINILRYEKADSHIIIYITVDGECIFSYEPSGLEYTKAAAVKDNILGSDMLNV